MCNSLERLQTFAQVSVDQYFEAPLEWVGPEGLTQLVASMRVWPYQRDELVHEVKLRGSGLYARLPPKKRFSLINSKVSRTSEAMRFGFVLWSQKNTLSSITTLIATFFLQ
jgi:hypothetical protein